MKGMKGIMEKFRLWSCGGASVAQESNCCLTYCKSRLTCKEDPNTPHQTRLATYTVTEGHTPVQNASTPETW